MAADDPADLAGEAFFASAFDGHALGRPIGGTPESIRAVQRDEVMAHYAEHYAPSGLVITAAGAVDHDAFCALVDEVFSGSPKARPVARRTAQPVADRAQERLTVVHRPTEQVSMLRGSQGTRPARRSATGPQRAQRRPGWRHELAAVPRGARAPRPGLRRVVLRSRVPGQRRVRRLRRVRTGQRRGRHRHHRRRVPQDGRRRHHRGRAAARQGPDRGRRDALARGRRRAHDPARAGRARDGGVHRPGHRARTRRPGHHRPTSSTWRATCSPVRRSPPSSATSSAPRSRRRSASAVE